jgi:hypothetical protein
MKEHTGYYVKEGEELAKFRIEEREFQGDRISC